MPAVVQILDYGSGNLFSIKDALSRAPKKISVKISSKYREGGVDALVLPGVGSFTSAQKVLGRCREAILSDVKRNEMPLLGVCLGMQLFFERSEEGSGDGLGIFKGNVVKFKPEKDLKVPHMGWNTFSLASKEPRFCKGLAKSEWVYYVHSYFPLPKEKSIVKAWTNYGDQNFPAIIARGNVFGTQFHPEKSSKAGSKLVNNFASMVSSR